MSMTINWNTVRVKIINVVGNLLPTSKDNIEVLIVFVLIVVVPRHFVIISSVVGMTVKV